jgi:hypothetical protein
VWRNSLLFSPTTTYGDYSWVDVIITPLAEAMRDAITAAAALGDLYAPPEASRPVVYMAMQGESRHTLYKLHAGLSQAAVFQGIQESNSCSITFLQDLYTCMHVHGVR